MRLECTVYQKTKDAVGDGRFRPGNATGQTGRNALSSILAHSFHYVKTTSSTKPEVHSFLHCRQRRTEPRRQVTSKENAVKFGRVVFEICERTDRQTVGKRDTLAHRHADHNTTHLYGQQSETLPVIKKTKHLQRVQFNSKTATHFVVSRSLIVVTFAFLCIYSIRVYNLG